MDWEFNGVGVEIKQKLFGESLSVIGKILHTLIRKKYKCLIVGMEREAIERIILNQIL